MHVKLTVCISLMQLQKESLKKKFRLAGIGTLAPAICSAIRTEQNRHFQHSIKIEHNKIDRNQY